MTGENLITLSDARRLGYCRRGCEEWCRRHGLDYQVLRNPGYPASVIAAVGDAMADRLIAAVVEADG